MTPEENAKMTAIALYLNPDVYNEDKAEGCEKGYMMAYKDYEDNVKCGKLITKDVVMKVIADIMKTEFMLDVEKADMIENLVFRTYKGKFPEIEEEVSRLLKEIQ